MEALGYRRKGILNITNVFWQHWGLNSGPHVARQALLLLVPLLQPRKGILYES
jgi:hypothetical protein